MKASAFVLLWVLQAAGLRAVTPAAATTVSLSPSAASALSPAAGTDAAVVLGFYQAFNAGDSSALAASLAPDFHSDAALPGLKPGPGGLVAWLAALRTAFPDGQVEVLDWLHQDGRVAVRYRFSGTQRGRFLSLRPTRKHAQVVGMDLWRVEAGKLVAQSGTLDCLGLLVQIGIAPELR
jgi:predicted ester cyclase